MNKQCTKENLGMFVMPLYHIKKCNPIINFYSLN